MSLVRKFSNLFSSNVTSPASQTQAPTGSFQQTTEIKVNTTAKKKNPNNNDKTALKTGKKSGGYGAFDEPEAAEPASYPKIKF